MHYLDSGPAYGEVSVAVTAGQALMPDGTTKKLKPTTGAVATAVGVARDAAAPAGSGTAMNFGVLRDEVAVIQAPATVRMTAAAGTDIPYGKKVVTAAAGAVTPISDTPAAADGTVVFGICMERGGITAGSTGLIKLV